MERFSSTSVRESLRGSKKRSGYNGNYHDTTGSASGGSTPTRKSNIKSVRFGAANKSRSRSAEQLSPVKLWRKLMISLGGNGAAASRKAPDAYAASEFDKRLVQEIYKSMSVTS